MARMKNGILGGLVGRIGDVEGYIVKGVPMLRARKRKTNIPPTLKQLAQRQKLSVTNKFIGSMNEFVAFGFGPFSSDKTSSANNAAKSYQMNHAIQGEYPDQSIDYSKVMLALGSLPPLANPQVAVDADNLKFSWTIDYDNDYYNSTARVMALAYCPDLNVSRYSVSGARRSEGEFSLELPVEFKEKHLEVYIAVIGVDLKQVSNSIYLGRL